MRVLLILVLFASVLGAQDAPDINSGSGENSGRPSEYLLGNPNSKPPWADRAASRNMHMGGLRSRIGSSRAGGHTEDSLNIRSTQIGLGFMMPIGGMRFGLDAGLSRQAFGLDAENDIDDIDLSVISFRFRSQLSFQFSESYSLIVGPTLSVIDADNRDATYSLGGFVMFGLRFGREFDMAVGIQAAVDVDDRDIRIRPQLRLRWQFEEDWTLQLMRDLRVSWQFSEDWSVSGIAGIQGGILGENEDYAVKNGFSYSSTHASFAFKYTFWGRSSAELGIGAMFNPELILFDIDGNELSTTSESLLPKFNISVSISF